MFELVPLIALALAVSLDGFAAALAYGVKSIIITITSLILISLTSGVSIWLSMFLGRLVSYFITPNIAEIIGGAILICLGTWFIFQDISIIKTNTTAVDQNQAGKDLEEKDQKKHKLLIRNVLYHPEQADVDQSGVLSTQEAILLGVALAMDAFSAGFAASLMGYHFFVTPIFVGVGKLILVPLGVRCGLKVHAAASSNKVIILPGSILIVLGLINLL